MGHIDATPGELQFIDNNGKCILLLALDKRGELYYSDLNKDNSKRQESNKHDIPKALAEIMGTRKGE